MIISCPSCQTKFRIADARLKPGGQKVRCSKCGHVWRISGEERQSQQEPDAHSSDRTPASDAERPAGGEPVAPLAERQPDVTEPRQPVLAAERAGGSVAGEERETAAREKEPPELARAAPSPNGLTEEQRARLSAARATQKKPRGGFWLKILIVFVIVGLVLLLALRMAGFQIPGLPELNKAIGGWTLEAPVREVGKVEAKPVPSAPATEGHIIGGDTPQSGN